MYSTEKGHYSKYRAVLFDVIEDIYSTTKKKKHRSTCLYLRRRFETKRSNCRHERLHIVTTNGNLEEFSRFILYGKKRCFYYLLHSLVSKRLST